jgi:hypothetical protein
MDFFGNHKDLTKVWSFGSQILSRVFLKSMCWYGFLTGFNLFHQCFILICTNIYSIKCCFIKDFL